MIYNNLTNQINLSNLSTSTELSPLISESSPTLHSALNGLAKPEKSLESIIKANLASLPFKNPVFTIVRNCNPHQSVSQNDSTNENSKIMVNYNRKEKSLGELSKKFLMMFGRIEKCVISLETVTQELGVERRRIYDIINILESLGVVFRKGKNNYQWNGLRSIHATINKIEKESLTMKEARIQQNYDDSDEEDSQNGKPSKKEKSLGLLSNGYIKLFFTWKSIISLEQAAKKLSSENIEENKIKTKIRRLYDIANVFTALGLIKKTCLEDSRKPAFQWIGLAGLDRFIKRLHASQDEKEIFEEKFTSKEIEPMNSDEKPKLKKSTSMSIQSEHSAFKVRETASPSHNGQQAMLENLLCLLLDLCKRELSKPEEAKPGKMIHESAEKISPFEGKNYTTPTIRKSVSIIQTIDTEHEITPPKKKEGLAERNILGDKTNSQENLKRSAAYKIDEFELRTLRKPGSFIENKALEFTVKKSLEFKGKENMSIEDLKSNVMGN